MKTNSIEFKSKLYTNEPLISLNAYISQSKSNLFCNHLIFGNDAVVHFILANEIKCWFVLEMNFNILHSIQASETQFKATKFNIYPWMVGRWKIVSLNIVTILPFSDP